MNQIRSYMVNGASEVEKSRISEEIKATILRVNSICRRYHICPEELPQPTHQAYKYLLSVDPHKIPINPKNNLKKQKVVKISKVLSFCNSIQNNINEFSHRYPDQKLIKELSLSIGNEIIRIENKIESQSLSIQDLSQKTFKAYQWLKFLYEENNLTTHIKTHQMLSERIGSLKHKKWGKRKIVEIVIYFISPLYSVQTNNHSLRLSLHEGFVGAPDHILDSITNVIFNGKISEDVRLLREYSEGQMFRRISRKANKSNFKDNGAGAKGEHFDLDEVFDKVKKKYFEDINSKPRLIWNKQITKRKLGHYNADTDTIMISIALDKDETPDFLIEYVMYHELLHKQIGFIHKNHKRYAHTPEFHVAEKEFDKYAQVKAYLKSKRMMG